jgi:hypothetical protein
MQQEDSLGCLEALIACIGHGRTVYLRDKVYIKGIIDIAAWWLKLWKIMTFGFDILALAWQDHTMTSTCWSALWCFPN